MALVAIHLVLEITMGDKARNERWFDGHLAFHWAAW